MATLRHPNTSKMIVKTYVNQTKTGYWSGRKKMRFFC